MKYNIDKKELSKYHNRYRHIWSFVFPVVWKTNGICDCHNGKCQDDVSNDKMKAKKSTVEDSDSSVGVPEDMDPNVKVKKTLAAASSDEGGKKNLSNSDSEAEGRKEKKLKKKKKVKTLVDSDDSDARGDGDDGSVLSSGRRRPFVRVRPL